LPGRFLDHAGWTRLLEETGFQDGAHWLEDKLLPEGTPCLVAARAPDAAAAAATVDAEAAPHWVLVSVTPAAPHVLALQGALLGHGRVTAVELPNLAQCLDELSQGDATVHVVGLLSDFTGTDLADGSEPCLFALDLVRGIQRSGSHRFHRVRKPMERDERRGRRECWSRPDRDWHDVEGARDPGRSATSGQGREPLRELRCLRSQLPWSCDSGCYRPPSLSWMLVNSRQP
jgi:hypothetical protein